MSKPEPDSAPSAPLPVLKKEPTQRIGDALADILREQIATMANGEQMPSVRTLMKHYKVSMLPVTQALKKLEKEKLIEARKGKGTYVSHLRNEKLIMLHRSRYLSIAESNRESSLRAAVNQVKQWNFVVRYHDSYPPLQPAIQEEPQASAHIVANDLCNMRTDLLDRLAAQKVPVLMIDHENPQRESFDSLRIDESQFFSRALQHLHELGHQHVAMVHNEPRFIHSPKHNAHFTRALHSMGMPPGLIIDCHTKPGTSSRESAYVSLRRYLSEFQDKPLPFTAILMGSPAGGVSALRALHDFGLEAPRDISVVVISGTVLENLLSVPSLTEALRSSGIECEYVIRILQGRFAGASPKAHHINARMDLFPRESTGPVPAKPAVPREVKPSVLDNPKYNAYEAENAAKGAVSLPA